MHGEHHLIYLLFTLVLLYYVRQTQPNAMPQVVAYTAGAMIAFSAFGLTKMFFKNNAKY